MLRSVCGFVGDNGLSSLIAVVYSSVVIKGGTTELLAVADA